MKYIAAVAAFAIILSGCKKGNTDTATSDNFLAQGQCLANVKGQNSVSICFDSLEGDSRCPLYAQCIWRGVAIANFTLKTGSAAIKFKLADYKTHLAGCPNDTTINNIHIILKEVTPYPGEAGYELKTKKVLLEIQ